MIYDRQGEVGGEENKLVELLEQAAATKETWKARLYSEALPRQAWCMNKRIDMCIDMCIYIRIDMHIDMRYRHGGRRVFCEAMAPNQTQLPIHRVL